MYSSTEDDPCVMYCQLFYVRGSFNASLSGNKESMMLKFPFRLDLRSWDAGRRSKGKTNHNISPLTDTETLKSLLVMGRLVSKN